ncbi:MAG: hypothetical protein AB1746_14105 [Candidatus Zixiibacteriota bacterium]
MEKTRLDLEKRLNIKIKKWRIKALTVIPANRQIPNMRIEVGQIYKNLEPNTPSEEVLAIFESVSFLVCAKNRGIDSGLPYFFAREDVRRVETIE